MTGGYLTVTLDGAGIVETFYDENDSAIGWTPRY
jgi:hypothetical protein